MRLFLVPVLRLEATLSTRSFNGNDLRARFLDTHDHFTEAIVRSDMGLLSFFLVGVLGAFGLTLHKERETLGRM